MIRSEGWINYEHLSLITNFKALQTIVIQDENISDPAALRLSQSNTFQCVRDLMVKNGSLRRVSLHVQQVTKEQMDSWVLADRVCLLPNS